MTSFLQLNNEPAPSNKTALVVATGDLDDWRRRMNEETKDLKQVSEQCNVDTGKRYKEDLEAATDVFEEALRKAKAASKEDETTNNEAYDARKKALSEVSWVLFPLLCVLEVMLTPQCGLTLLSPSSSFFIFLLLLFLFSFSLAGQGILG